MSGRDRDRSFEKALARHFSNAPLPDAPGPLCPDAETLAAYHENALAPQELLSWKQHFASCSRCQELLKQLGATDHLVLQPLDVEKPAALAGPSSPVVETRRSWRLEWVPYWRWVVPAGALAAGLLVWVAIRQRPSFDIQMAKNQQPASPTQPDDESSRAASLPKAPANREAPGPAASREADQAPADRIPSSIPPGDPSKTRNQVAPEKKASVASQANTKRMEPPAPQLRDQNADGTHHAKERERTEDSFSRYSLERPPVKPRAVQRRPDAAADLRQEGAALSAQAPVLPETMAQSRITLPETNSAQSAQAKALAGTSGTRPEEMEKLQSARSPNGRLEFRNVSAPSSATILAPDGRVLWRVGVVGMIERSADGGKTWVAQRSPIAVDLLAGSAVSDQVCWIIGRAGTILRTTDGGVHWQKLPSPSAQDLSAVRATDAQQAVIFDATNQRSYKTTDGGASWTELPAE